jgi:FKBP-type peptidyl-prolyl cis-trans isomerase 2
MGDTILVNYEARLKNGDVFESSRTGNPLAAKIGASELPEGLEEALLGMQIGERKTVILEPDKAYGHYNENLFKKIPKNDLPEDLIPQKGMRLFLLDKEKKVLPVIVSKIHEESIEVDANHPLAGKFIIYELEVMQIS